MGPFGRRALIGAAAALGLGSGAYAADWRVGGFFSQRFSVTDNYDLDPDGGGGATFGSVTDLGVAITGQTGRGRLLFAPGVRALGYVGGDAEDESAIRPRLNASYAWQGLRDDVSASLSVIPESANDTSFEEGRRRQEEAFVLAISGALGFGRQVDPLNRVGLDLFARTEEYLDDTETAEPSRSFGGEVSWRRALDPVSAATLSTGVTRFVSEGEEGEDGTSYQITLGYETAVSERLSWNARGGVSFIQSEGDVEPGFVGGIGATYRTADTTLDFSLAQDVDQDSDGAIENRLSARFGARRRVNSRDSLGLDLVLGANNPLFFESDDDRQIASLTPSFTREITEDWSVTAGYALRLENEDDFAWSNTAFVTFSRGLSLLP